MRFHIADASVIGPAHLASKLPNQDHVSLRGFKGGWITVVSDGLGSHRHSDIGSWLACRAVQNYWRSVADNYAEERHQAIHQNWLQSIYPYSIKATGATCLYANILKNGWIRIGQLGDGLVIYRQNGQFNQLTPKRQGFGNQTASLNATFQASDWVYDDFHLTQAGDGIILMTDGIADDLIPESLPEFFDLIYQESLKHSRRRMKHWLERELNNWTTPLHGDDKTLSAIFLGN